MESADINGIGVTMKGFDPRRSRAFRSCRAFLFQYAATLALILCQDFVDFIDVHTGLGEHWLQLLLEVASEVEEERVPRQGY